MNIKHLLLRKIDKQDLEYELAAIVTIGERLRFLRKNYLKLSRSKLSAAIGIEANMLNKYENGYFEPKSDRIKQFADFYDIPVEYITGEISVELLKEDYFLISNLHMYCWQIDRDLVTVTNRAELEIALYKANKIVIQALNRLRSRKDEFAYIFNLFSNDKDISLLNVPNKDNFLLFFDKKILDLQKQPDQHPHSMDRISRIIEFGICTADALTKKEYKQVIYILTPLIQSYKEFEEKNN